MTRPGPILGCIADDFTGAVDVAAGTFAAGLRTVILTDPASVRATDAEVVVVALKTRTAPVAAAVAASRQAAVAFGAIGVRQLFFKYCSTFDSTATGNIGPVADALIELVEQAVTVLVPGYPANGRTVDHGQLYVDGVRLSESPMRHHPLTPMTSADVPELMARQSRHLVAVIGLGTVRTGTGAITAALADCAAAGTRYAVLDSILDADIKAIARAVADHRLVTGGAALAHALAALAARAASTGSTGDRVQATPERASVPNGRRVVLSGSCSAATQRQVADFARTHPTLQLDPGQLADPEQAAADATRWAVRADPERPVLISTTVGAEELQRIGRDLGPQIAATRIETFFATVAQRLLEHGFDRMLVAGGETSGAVTAALKVRELVVTAPISSGLAWCVSGEPRVALALKSGNFGADDVFSRAHRILDNQPPAPVTPR